jgi:D-amino-acid dehydrogenase
MHVLVIGAGVAGLCTAWFLEREGLAVTVLDREDDVARGASGGNGAQLSYSYVAPLAEPSVLGKLPTLLADPASPLKYHFKLDPDQWAWGLKFLAACRIDTARATTAALLQLSFLSRSLLEPLIARERIDCDFDRGGKLVVYPDAAGLAQARAQMEFQATLGCEQELLDNAQCLEHEPALAGYVDSFVGGVWTPSEAAADCGLFCAQIGARLRKRGVAFRFGANVARVTVRAGKPDVLVGRERISADAVVIANGSRAPALAGPLGIKVPIYPLKGYSITVAVARGATPPTCSITDTRRKVVFAPLGTGKQRRVRVAGFVEMAGHNPSIPPARIKELVEATRAVIGLEASGDLAPWRGFRPATPTGLPVLGRSRVPGVFVNAGQGALGWTLAAGSARVVADAIVGRASTIDVTPYAAT